MTTATDAPVGFRPSLATAIFALFALLLGLVLGTVTLVTWREGQRIATAAVERALGASAEVQRELTERRLEEVTLKVQLIASDADFVRYVSDAQGDGLGLGSAAALGAASIVDLLRERQASYRFDVGIVLDPDGTLIARSDEVEALAESMADDPFVAASLADLRPIAGFWRHRDRLYQAAILPLALDRDLVGFLLLALSVDDALASRIARASGAEIAFLLPRENGVALVATSLPQASRQGLSTALADPAIGIGTAALGATPLERTSFASGNGAWIGRLTPVDAAGGARLGSVLQFAPSDGVSAGYRQIVNLVALSGLLALAVALPLSFLLARVTLKPLGAMARAAEDAVGGNYRARLSIAGSDDLARLASAFDRLLSELREKSDIEGYVTNLSRFLPDPGQPQAVPSFVTQQVTDPAEAAIPTAARLPATRTPALLLALELRDLARAQEPAEAMLGAAESRIAAARAAAVAAGGELVVASGTRLVVAFAGTERLRDALGVLGALVHGADPALAAALLDGEVVLGGDAGSPLALGAACFQLDRLLTESRAGHALLPKSLEAPVRAALGERAGPAIVAGALTGKSYFGIAFTALPAAAPKADLTPGDAVPTRKLASAALAAMSPHGGELRPGTRFGGRYEILSLLGSGGMGVVYKARDLELDDLVALKMIKAQALVDQEHLERLKSEIKLARRITHPNVLRTFDFGESQGRPYISMEYVRGMTLRYLLRQAGRLPYSAALRIARQLCAGLEAAHAVGVLHRDIKPENLILEASGNAKLMDFGIARPLARDGAGQTQPGTFVGTPHYSAPEQLAGEDVDQRADIYACGVMLCEMFCGKLPFTGNSTVEIYLAQMQQEPIRPSAWWPEIPRPLEAVILRCIERERERRFAGAAALGAALAELRA